LNNIEIRPATIDDAALVLQFITELAIFEKAKHEVHANVADIETSLFGEGSTTKSVICTLDGKPVGFAVYFFSYSTWLGKHGLFLEDLYVTPDRRGYGLGKSLLKHLANIAVANNCGRFEWNVLDWNEPAIQFYQSLGAKPQDEWIGYRLSGAALENFARE
jgi:GNAT superfamily N-acetyltransferase